MYFIIVNLTIKRGDVMHDHLSDSQLYVTVDLLILTVRSGELNLLLSRRTASPYEGRWALAGRFIGMDESAEASASRLLKEMLPIRNAYYEQLYTFTDVNRDPRGRVISTAYLVIVPWGQLQPLMTEGKLAFECFRVSLDEKGLKLHGDKGEELLSGDLAFDHGRIIETGINRLQGKVDYTDIAFRFLENPLSFSLGELQTVFEAILEEKLDSSNFRRTILGKYEKSGRLRQTSRTEQQGRGRPAALYCIKWK